MASAALAMAVHRPDRLALELETYVTAEATTRRPLDLLGMHGFLLRSSLAASALGDSRWRQRWKTLGRRDWRPSRRHSGRPASRKPSAILAKSSGRLLPLMGNRTSRLSMHNVGSSWRTCAIALLASSTHPASA